MTRRSLKFHWPTKSGLHHYHWKFARTFIPRPCLISDICCFCKSLYITFNSIHFNLGKTRMSCSSDFFFSFCFFFFRLLARTIFNCFLSSASDVSSFGFSLSEHEPIDAEETFKTLLTWKYTCYRTLWYHLSVWNFTNRTIV